VLNEKQKRLQRILKEAVQRELLALNEQDIGDEDPRAGELAADYAPGHSVFGAFAGPAAKAANAVVGAAKILTAVAFNTIERTIGSTAKALYDTPAELKSFYASTDADREKLVADINKDYPELSDSLSDLLKNQDFKAALLITNPGPVMAALVAKGSFAVAKDVLKFANSVTKGAVGQVIDKQFGMGASDTFFNKDSDENTKTKGAGKKAPLTMQQIKDRLSNNPAIWNAFGNSDFVKDVKSKVEEKETKGALDVLYERVKNIFQSKEIGQLQAALTQAKYNVDLVKLAQTANVDLNKPDMATAFITQIKETYRKATVEALGKAKTGAQDADVKSLYDNVIKNINNLSVGNVVTAPPANKPAAPPAPSPKPTPPPAASTATPPATAQVAPGTPPPTKPAR